MTELTVNKIDISGYLGADALADGKLDETELIEAINNYNDENNGNQITGDLAITYSSSEITLDDTILDEDIAGTSATIKDSATSKPNNDIQSQLADEGIDSLTSGDGELIIYASTPEELAAVEKVMQANGVEYDVTTTDKTEAEIQEYLDGTLSTDFPDGVTSSTKSLDGTELTDLVSNGIMDMTFYDESGNSKSYSINDSNAVAQFKTWLETEKTTDSTDTSSAVESTDSSSDVESTDTSSAEEGVLTENLDLWGNLFSTAISGSPDPNSSSGAFYGNVCAIGCDVSGDGQTIQVTQGSNWEKDGEPHSSQTDLETVNERLAWLAETYGQAAGLTEEEIADLVAQVS